MRRRPRPESAPLEPMFDRLEARQMLFANTLLTAMPSAGLLENPSNSVVRIATNVGNIDVELFDSRPGTGPAIANFRQYITSGRLDESFFHTVNPGIFVGGGIFKYADGLGLQNIPFFTPFPNAFTSANLERTLALAPITLTTSTSQFIINLQNNPSFNAANGGYAVFGRVIQGWNVVTTIAGLSRQNFSPVLLPGSPTNPVFQSVPVTPQYNPGAGIQEFTLVRINDIEFIKSTNTLGFFTQSVVYPEGRRGANTIEFLDIGNIAEDVTGVQVIARYRSGDRDSVLWNGQLIALGRTRLTLSHFQLAGNNTVRANVDYTLEVRSTRPITASIQRRLGSSASGESFMNPGSTSLTATQLGAWHFAGLIKKDRNLAFVSWAGLSDTSQTVSVQVYAENNAVPSVYNFSLKPYQTGGASLHDLVSGLAEDTRYAVRIFSTGATVAALSRQRLSGGATPTVSDSSSELGAIATGRPTGFLAAARITTGQQAYLDFFATNPNLIASFITVNFHLNNGTVITISPGIALALTSANRRIRFDMTQVMELPRDEFFSISYIATGNINIAASYTSDINGDSMSTPFTYAMTDRVHFADGFYNPGVTPAGTIDETISLFNPFSRVDGAINYQIFFNFADGTRVAVPPSLPATLQPRARIDFRTRDIAAVMTKINSGSQFQNYTIDVFSFFFAPVVPNAAIVVQLTRVWNNLGIALTSNGQLSASAPVVFSNSPTLTA